jgi:hypothetical protein
MSSETRPDPISPESFRPAVELGEVVRPDRNQQNRLLLAMHSGAIHEALFADKVQVDDHKFGLMRDEVAERLPEPKEMSELLAQIQTPSEVDPGAVLESMGETERKILAYFRFDDINAGDSMTDQDLAKLVERMPDVVQFMNAAPRLLDDIEVGSENRKPGMGRVKRAKYEQAMERFGAEVYGVQYQYWKQFELLFGDAMGANPQWESRRRNWFDKQGRWF